MKAVCLWIPAVRLRCLLYCSGARVFPLSYSSVRHWAVHGKRSVCVAVRRRIRLRLRVVVWVRLIVSSPYSLPKWFVWWSVGDWENATDRQWEVSAQASLHLRYIFPSCIIARPLNSRRLSQWLHRPLHRLRTYASCLSIAGGSSSSPSSAMSVLPKLEFRSPPPIRNQTL